MTDNTGPQGLWNFDVHWDLDAAAPEAAPDGDLGVSVFTAIQEQLGLKLEPVKGPVEMLVIDHMERPAEN